MTEIPMLPFHILLIIGLAYREYKKHKNSLLMSLITSVLSSSKKSDDGEGISKAVKSASKAFLVKYRHDNKEYEMVVPTVRRRAMRWTVCTATYQDGSTQDITEHAEYRAGPFKDFFGLHDKLHPSHIATGASELVFTRGEKVVMQIGGKGSNDVGDIPEILSGIASEMTSWPQSEEQTAEKMEEMEIPKIDLEEAKKLLEDEFE